MMSSVAILRLVTLTEGVSYLLLVLVAMPLKYLWELPVAVRVAGAIHGVLFVTFLLSLVRTHVEHSWTRRHTASLLLGSLLPGSLWWLDRKIRAGS